MAILKFIFCTQIVEFMEICYQSEELIARDDFLGW